MNISLKTVLAMALLPLFDPSSHKIGLLGHFPALLQTGEPFSGLILIPIVTQHVTGLVSNMIMSPKIYTRKESASECVILQFFSISTALPLPRFCLFVTDPKHRLGIIIYSTHQELQFERKRSFLAQFVQEIWAKPWHKLYQKCQKWPPPSCYRNPLQFFFGGSFSTAKANLKISTSQATLMLTFPIPRYKYSA